MLAVADKVCSCLLAAWRFLVAEPHVSEGVVLIKLWHFKVSGILPLGVLVLSIEEQCMLVIMWNLKTALASGCCVTGMQLGLVDQLDQLVASTGESLELLPTLLTEQTIVTSMLSTCGGVILANNVEWLCSNFTIFPLQQDIVQ